MGLGFGIGIGIGKLIRQTPNTRQNEERPYFFVFTSFFALLCFAFVLAVFSFLSFLPFFFFFWPVSFAAVAFLCQCALFVSHFPTLQTLSLSLSHCVFCVCMLYYKFK